MLCVHVSSYLLLGEASGKHRSCVNEQFNCLSCELSSLLCKDVVEGICQQWGFDLDETWKSFEACATPWDRTLNRI
jgi:hypothetical protein